MSEGLVQRRRTKPAADPDDDRGSNEGKNQNDDNQNNDDIDSKETRLTLMEEVLLLGLKDKEG